MNCKSCSRQQGICAALPIPTSMSIWQRQTLLSRVILFCLKPGLFYPPLWQTCHKKNWKYKVLSRYRSKTEIDMRFSKALKNNIPETKNTEHLSETINPGTSGARRALNARMMLTIVFMARHFTIWADMAERRCGQLSTKQIWQMFRRQLHDKIWSYRVDWWGFLLAQPMLVCIHHTPTWPALSLARCAAQAESVPAGRATFFRNPRLAAHAHPATLTMHGLGRTRSLDGKTVFGGFKGWLPAQDSKSKKLLSMVGWQLNACRSNPKRTKAVLFQRALHQGCCRRDPLQPFPHS